MINLNVTVTAVTEKKTSNSVYREGPSLSA